MAKQSKAQNETMECVMHEFKQGELETGTGKKVTNPKQAIAIGLSEAGTSNQQSLQENRRKLRQTKARERKGETAKRRTDSDGPTRAELYEKAKTPNIPGRSKMSKAELERAIRG